MRSFTKVILPIIVIIGLIFGITYVSNFSNRDPIPVTNNTAASPPPLVIPLTTVSWSQNDGYLTKYWKSGYETLEDGHFDFWFHNANAQPVHLDFQGANCVCGSTQVGVIPPSVWKDYVASLLAPKYVGGGAATVLNCLGALQLKSHIDWVNLRRDQNHETTIPAATPADGCQMGIIRINWTGKIDEGPKSLEADYASRLPDATAQKTVFKLQYQVVPPFHIYVSDGKPNEIHFGEIPPRSTATRDFIIWSMTRDNLDLEFSLVNPKRLHDCITWTAAQKLSPQDLVEFTKKIQLSDDIRFSVRCAYRLSVSIHESRMMQGVMKHLDLGPFRSALSVQSAGKSTPVSLYGVVRGDIRMMDGAEPSDGIDFGQSFPSNEERSKTITLLSDRAGLDLEKVINECTPEFLRIELLPLKDQGGRKKWRLTVTIPANSLFGSLTHGQVVLQTKDTNARRLQIPIYATSYGVR